MLTILFIICALFPLQGYCAGPHDEIFLSNFNESYYIANETYVFQLVPAFRVPLNIFKHTIYTATSETITKITKRFIFESAKELEELAPEDYYHLEGLIGQVPHIVKVNSKKRSLSTVEGLRVIQLTKRHTILSSYNEEQLESRKRGLSQVSLGGTFCLHIPFATSCDNGGDVNAVKEALTIATQGLYTEIDSYKETNNLRDEIQARTLSEQARLVAQIAENVADTTRRTMRIANAVAMNAAQTMHGDYIIHSQVNYLKRITNNLLKYQNTLASTDPRTVTAQPSLTKLFEGYEVVRKYLTNTSLLPIVDTRVFNWNETLLPQNSVTNIVEPESGISTSAQFYYGFRHFINGNCYQFINGTTNECLISDQRFSIVDTVDPRFPGRTGHTKWMFGPFHKDHVGIYDLLASNTTQPTGIIAMRPVVPDATRTNFLSSDPSPNLYCVNYLGFVSLASFNETPNMINGVPPGGQLNLSKCYSLMLKDPIPGFTPDYHYRLFAIYEGIVVPFYSNCDGATFTQLTNVTTGYLSQYPTLGGSPTLNDQTAMELFQRHYTTNNGACYMNLDPSWIGLTYYINSSDTKLIENIPRGFKLDQFTINPEGELSSSLEFVYTSQWAWVYNIKRISTNNRVITDEITMLDNDLVLFVLNGTRVVDESDEMYGVGNNGRDCIREANTYEYDLTSCFYQNNQQQYTANQYLTGSIATTGIARFINKFNFRVTNTTVNNAPSYEFSLTAKDEADFNFYVLMDGQVCPTLNSNSQSSTSGCSLSFSYFGRDSPVLKNVNSNNFVNKPQDIGLSFVNNQASVNVDFGLWQLNIGARPCYLLNCIFEFSDTTLQVTTPQVQIHSQQDVKLTVSVNLAIGNTMNETLEQMRNIAIQGEDIIENITDIVSKLNLIDFNVSGKYPYEDFSDLRQKVFDYINSIKSVSETGGGDCGGIFGGIGCWFSDLAGRIITIVIIVGVCIGAYLICFKLGVAKMIFSRKKRFDD